MGCCHSAQSETKPTAFFAFGKVHDLHERPFQSAPPTDPVDFIATLTKDRPLDGSDVQQLELAKKQITFIRRYARHFLDNLTSSAEEGFMSRQFRGDIRRSAIYENEDYFGDFCKRVSVVYKSDEIKQLIMNSIKPNVLFEDNSEEEIVDIVDVFRPVSFKRGDTVINQGDVGDQFFVVESGELIIRITVGEGDEKSEVIGGTYQRGSTFGELALLFGSLRAATVMATKPCQLWCLDRLAYRGVVRRVRYNNRKEKLTLLKCSDIGHILDKTMIEDLSLTLKPEKFFPGDVILREGEENYTIYFIRSGSVEKRRKDSYDRVEELKQNDSFGLESLLDGGSNDATYVASAIVSVYFFTKNEFESMVGNIHDVQDGKLKSRSVLRFEKKSFMDIETPRRVVLELDQLNYFNKIGKGDFSEVTLVQSKISGDVYALKAFSKHFIVQKGQQNQLLNEFRILRYLDHPNIGKIHCAMQDEKKVYFLLDLLPGGELLKYLIKRGKFSENETRFYAASVVLALDHTTSMMIAHRDIKPENLMLDRKGYCVLVDFALAKEVTEGQTFTFCGTPDYLAPEIIRGIGHDWGVDCWALGVLIFELSYGTAPFYSPNHLKRTRKILKGYSSASLPGGMSNSFGCLLSQLLVTDQSNRLGRTRNGIQSIKNHRWFAGLDWEGLLKKSILAPIEPGVQTDTKELGQRDLFSKKIADDSQESDWWPSFSTI